MKRPRSITNVRCTPGHNRVTMFIGDSITFGSIGLDTVGVIGGYRAPLFVANPGMIAAGSFFAYGYHNGYRGLRIDEMSPLALVAVPKFAPSMILLMAGTNDINQGESGAATFIELQNFAIAIKANSGVDQLLVSTIPWLNAAHTQESAYNAAILAWSPPAGIQVVDASGALIYPTDFAADGLHPITIGYAKMAAGWSPAVSALL